MILFITLPLWVSTIISVLIGGCIIAMIWIWTLVNKTSATITWIYGTCNNIQARKNRIKGNVQFVLWKAGEQGHLEHFWHDFDHSWWKDFKSTK